jgi:hypothetical protein
MVEGKLEFIEPQHLLIGFLLCIPAPERTLPDAVVDAPSATLIVSVWGSS